MVIYESMTTEKLLGLLIGEQASEGVMKEFPTLPYAVVESTENELTQVKGVGTKRAIQIKALGELARRLYKCSVADGCIIKSPNDVAAVVMADMRYLRKEQFRVLLLNTKNRVIEQRSVSEGSLSASIVHPREVFVWAVKRSAAGVIFVHNHPSGDPEPSGEDVETTSRLVKAGELLGVKVLDHVIIGDGRLLSLKERRLM
jgi:DNA repair protein RadC